jgi:hypothetical protein
MNEYGRHDSNALYFNFLFLRYTVRSGRRFLIYQSSRRSGMQRGPDKVSVEEKARDEAQMHGIWNHITFSLVCPLTFRQQPTCRTAHSMWCGVAARRDASSRQKSSLHDRTRCTPTFAPNAATLTIMRPCDSQMQHRYIDPVTTWR